MSTSCPIFVMNVCSTCSNRFKKVTRQALGSQDKTQISELGLRNAKWIHKVIEGERVVFFFFQAKSPSNSRIHKGKRRRWSETFLSHTFWPVHSFSDQTLTECLLCAKLVTPTGDASVSRPDTVLCPWDCSLWKETVTQEIPKQSVMHAPLELVVWELLSIWQG